MAFPVLRRTWLEMSKPSIQLTHLGRLQANIINLSHISVALINNECWVSLFSPINFASHTFCTMYQSFYDMMHAYMYGELIKCATLQRDKHQPSITSRSIFSHSKCIVFHWNLCVLVSLLKRGCWFSVVVEELPSCMSGMPWFSKTIAILN